MKLLFPRFGDDADGALAAFISEPTDELRLAIYSFNNPLIVQAVAAQQAARVPLRLITDHVQSFGAAQTKALSQLLAAGVPIKVNHHSGLMHLKLAVRGGKPPSATALGSFNWTHAAESINDEVLAIDEAALDAALFVRAAYVFDAMWNDARRFVDWHPALGLSIDETRSISAMPEFQVAKGEPDGIVTRLLAMSAHVDQLAAEYLDPEISPQRKAKLKVELQALYDVLRQFGPRKED